MLEKRNELVARKITEFLKATNRFDKTIVFCEDIPHAERMRSLLINENSDLYSQNSKYVMQITGDNNEGKAELDNFILPESKYPVIVSTSKLLSTGVDAEYDPFDLVAHVAFGQKPLTRRERADNVKKRNYFAKYEGKARVVLEALLDKYADEGLSNLEDPKVLKLKPFDNYGTPVEIFQAFGGKAKYDAAVKELEQDLYHVA